jgi:hypothetical protein
VLSEQIEHHVHEEERRSDGIFSQARAAGLDMDELGDRLKARKDAILAEFKASGIPGLASGSWRLVTCLSSPELRELARILLRRCQNHGHGSQ